MKKISLILTILFCSASVFAATSTMSPDPDMMGPGAAYCQNHHMPPKECKAQMEKFKNATPDEKMAMMKDRWSKMTPEERKMAMDRMVMKFKTMDADSQKATMQMMQDSMNGK
ncbi:MAG: hypothetical protein K0R48_842 [Gammaproteobacteria bacterium]|jgi:hypothetical protein|nr:hypothetical protein [Gammaproteobacteria bacterium]